MHPDHSTGIEDYSQDLSISRLCADVAVVIWDIPAPAKTMTKCTIEASTTLVPLVSLAMPLETGGQRMFWAMRTKDEPVAIKISNGGSVPSQEVMLYPAAELDAFDVERALGNIGATGHIKLLNNLLSTWRSAFRLSQNTIFAGVAREVTIALTPEPREVRSCGQPIEGHHLLETALDPDLGAVTAVYGISGNSVISLPVKLVIGHAAKKGLQQCHLLVESARALPKSFRFVFSGKNGIAVRKLAESNGETEFQKWWSKRQGDASMRAFLVRNLAKIPGVGVATAIDMQIRAPLPARQIAKSPTQPSGEVDLALALDGGLLVGGWTNDPSGMLKGIEYAGEDGTALPLDPNFYSFPGKTGKNEDGSRSDVTGFVAWLPHVNNLGPLLQPRFQMRLISGATSALVPQMQPFEVGAQRNCVLRAVPPQHAKAHVFENILAPALREVEQKIGKTVRIADVKDYGVMPESPLVSIVIPLYRNLDFLRFQLSAMATDPWLVENAEVIFVLDSPEIQDDTEHMLGGLHILHDLPMKLAIMNRNGGYARACNAGASFATGTILVMLNSDVVPCKAGWLDELINPLFKQKKLGAVGPKLLFEDGSLQHAGLYFARDQRGIWLNHHFYKGMPGDYSPAQLARSVPGVTGACLVTRKDIYDLVGGFTEDYVIGDYEDSDLCLKIRQIGFQIAYEPGVALYHFERRSIRRSSDYMRGLASQYNSWLHTQRWNRDISELMTRYLDETDEDTVTPFVSNKSERSAA
ncbi:glycosyltransferase family 2 protein [Phyllobacterium sp. YR531]|uniref:glycosyltransferase family 2 protein n=1 Tax=Phyllobacterium sp. YR531 TaxID=1144343 RepID=UPI00026F6CCB|nr:glycosyltransferase family 2 protein [Phyllobacterium sp. YR531]EJN02783.1 putative glycosyltransferase [Phyllobacterium sp. YR531]